MKKMTSKLSVLLLILTLGIFGCASSQTENSRASGGSSGSPNGSGPEVGNLPPPSQAQVGQGDAFFKNKEIYDAYSPEMKALVQKNYESSFKKLNPEVAKSGTYVVTPMGHAISLADSPKETFSETNIQNASNQLGDIAYGVMTSCDPSKDFVCVEQPIDNDSVDVASPNITIKGSMDVCRSAVFYPVPDLNVIVYDKMGTEIYKRSFCDVAKTPMGMPACNTQPNTEDLGATGRCSGATPARIGNFLIPTVSLNKGQGKYKIVFDATDRLGLAPKVVNVVVSGDPEIALADKDPFLSPNKDPGNLYPDGVPKLNTPVNNNDQVSMAYVRAKIKLVSEGSAGIALQFENYTGNPDDADPMKRGSLRYTTSGNFTNYTDLKLFRGVNFFKVKAYRVGKPMPVFNSKNSLLFSFTNEVDPTVKVKILSKEIKTVEVPIKPACSMKDNQPYCPPCKEEGGKTLCEFCWLDTDNKTRICKYQEVSTYKTEAVTVSFCFEQGPSLPGKTLPLDGQGCITNWRNEPTDRSVIVNGRAIDSTKISQTAPGIFKFEVIPPDLQVGVNFFKIDGAYGGWDSAKPDLGLKITGTAVDSFGSGKVLPLFTNNGQLNNKSDSFIPGMQAVTSIQVHEKVLNEDLKRMVMNYLNADSFAQNLNKLLQSGGTPTYATCNVSSGRTVTDDGKFSAETLPGFKIGSRSVDPWGITLSKDGVNRFYITLTINGLHGPMNFITGSNVADRIPIELGIAQLKVNIAARFVQDPKTRLNQLVIEQQPEATSMIHVGRDYSFDAAGRFIHSDYTSEIDRFQNSFIDAIEANLRCFITNKINKNPTDILELVNYDLNDPLRFSTTFDFLGSQKSIDVAYDLLRASNISFTDIDLLNPALGKKLQITNVPIRINPGASTLTQLLGDANFSAIVKSVFSVGAFSSPAYVPAPPPPGTKPAVVDQDHQIIAGFYEDLLNQALFALSEGGLLDLTVDPSFFTKNGIPFLYQATLQASDILANTKIDINQDGVIDANDTKNPVQLRTMTDKILPPHLHFLNYNEKSQWINQMEKEAKADGRTISIDRKANYFRLTLSNFEIGIYAVEATPNGLKTYCKGKSIPDPDIDPATQKFRTRGAGATPLITPLPAGSAGPVCAQPVSIFFPLADGTKSCPLNKDMSPMTSVEVQTDNGKVISAIKGQTEAPLAKVRLDMVLYGVIQGTFEEKLTSDLYDNAGNIKTNEPKPAKFIRIRLLDSSKNNFGSAGFFKNVMVTKNNTGETDANIVERLDAILGTAFNPTTDQPDCGAVGEFTIRLDSLRFPGEKTAADSSLVKLLGDLGVSYLDLGGSRKEEWPLIVGNESYQNIFLNLGIGWK